MMYVPLAHLSPPLSFGLVSFHFVLLYLWFNFIYLFLSYHPRALDDALKISAEDEEVEKPLSLSSSLSSLPLSSSSERRIEKRERSILNDSRGRNNIHHPSLSLSPSPSSSSSLISFQARGKGDG